MKVMREVAVELLEKKDAASTEIPRLPFDAIWQHVNVEIGHKWEGATKKFVNAKMGELYTMMTTNGEFVKDKDDMWSLTKNYTFSEIQKMKINVGELED